MNLGENIYKFRTQKNMSQGDLADALDVSRQSVSKWENDSAVPELDKLVKMAQIFGITIDELVSGGKQDASAPPPPQYSASESTPSKPGLTSLQILGIVLLIFGALCLLIFTVVGIFVSEWTLGVWIGLPIALCGGICLLCKKNIGLKCAWVIYLILWMFFMVVYWR